MYKKNKFWFVYNDNIKKEHKNNDMYFRYEWRLKLKFPFIFYIIIQYNLIDDIWVEQI